MEFGARSSVVIVAADTNVVVRLLANDDPKQTAAARALFSKESIWIAKTVFLETNWVLRSVYKFADEAILDSLAKLLGLENVQAEDSASVAAALALASHGVDFADALHLSSRPQASIFVTFDESFVRRAKRAGQTAIGAP
jgi:predicted nucleic-acid-binding protein